MSKDEKRILVTRSSLPPFEEYVEAIRPLWETRWLTNMGANHEALSRRLEEYLKVENISLFTNGHMALELVLQALKLEGEVITTPFTFVSTTHAIVRNGLTPVFCDINEDDYTIDASKIESLITPKTCAIVPVHVYGTPCDVEAIEAIAKKHNLKVIYDAAHAFGVEVNGRGIASYGDASMFSFHATKVYNTIEGGAIATANKDLIEDLYRLKDFGIRGEEVIDGIGANAKMNEFCAIMGLCNLNHVDEEIAKRKVVAERYRSNFEGVDGIRVLPIKENVKTNYAYFPIVIDETVFGTDRNEIKKVLAESNIGVRKYFYPLTSDVECYDGRFDNIDIPVARQISQRVLTVPMFADLEVEDVDRICSIICSLKK